MGKLKQFLVELRSSLWFVPFLIVMAATGLALGLVRLDPVLGDRWGQILPEYLRVTQVGSREVLSAIAGSMITVAGVVFSITVVTLALAAQQFTPRVLRNFMRDRGTQVVLGVFVGVFSYCVIALVFLSAEQPPQLIALVAVVLALVGLGHLIYFIHHIAELIQSTHISAAIRAEAVGVLEEIYPRPAADQPAAEPGAELALAELHWEEIPATETGYIQRIEGPALCRLAAGFGVVFHVPHQIGDFVIRGLPLVRISPRLVDPALVRAVNRLVVTGKHRTIEQDLEFGVRQLVDIGLKALSPSINDTSTAISCVDQLGAILCQIGDRPLRHGPWRSNGQVRVVIEQTSFERLLRHAFEQISDQARDNPAVLERQLDTLRCLVKTVTDPLRRQLILARVDNILECARRGGLRPAALGQVQDGAEQIRRQIGTGPRRQAA